MRAPNHAARAPRVSGGEVEIHIVSGHGGVILGRGAVVVINDYVWVERKFGDPDGGHARAADTADLITAAGALATPGTTAATELPLRQALALRLLAIGTAGPTGAGGLRRGPCNAGRRHPCCAGCHPGNPRPRFQLPRWQLPAARLRAPQSPAARSLPRRSMLTDPRQGSLGVAPSAIATYATRITLRRPSASSATGQLLLAMPMIFSMERKKHEEASRRACPLT